MARASVSSSIVTLFRFKACVFRRTPGTQIRKLCVESKEVEFGSNGSKQIVNLENPSGVKGQFSDIAKEVAVITRDKPRWEEILLSDFGSFNFADPNFFLELVKHQNNAFFSLMFFRWLRERHGFVPDQVSCNVLFGLLLDAKAFNEAKWFLSVSQSVPDWDLLERYVGCLCVGGMVQDALEMFPILKEIGVRLSIATWNLALWVCLRVKRTDIFWKVYQNMVECGAVADIDGYSIRHIIQALCMDGQELQGYALLKQVLEDGLVPHKVVFDELISVFSMNGYYFIVSEIFNIMIARNLAPDAFTYQRVINGLWKTKRPFEALRLFKDIKARGYMPDRVLYTTMIHGLGNIGQLTGAMELWHEMVGKGIDPDNHTYSALIHGCFKNGNLKMARALIKEMRDRGYRETTEICNMIIWGLGLRRLSSEAFQLFEEMKEKGITRNVATYNGLIASFSRSGRIITCKNLLKEMLVQGLVPTTASFVPIIKWLCRKEKVQRAKKFWNEMLSRGLNPRASDYDLFVSALCKKGCASDGLEWLVAMLHKQHIPQQQTFERLLQCLACNSRLDDVLLVLNYMFSVGHAPKEGMCYYLVRKFCRWDQTSVQTCVNMILENSSAATSCSL